LSIFSPFIFSGISPYAKIPFSSLKQGEFSKSNPKEQRIPTGVNLVLEIIV